MGSLIACCGTRMPTLCAGRWRRGADKTGRDKGPDTWVEVGAPGYLARLKRSTRLFPAANAIIPCGQRDYSRLAAIAGGGRVRIQQSEPRSFSECKLHPA